MKSIQRILLMILVNFSISQAQIKTGELSADRLVYSEEEDAIIPKDAGQHSNELVIESLPGMEELSIPLLFHQQPKGSYTIKKDPGLELPEFYNVIIEDTLTGNQFDLKYAESYSFSVNRFIPERFVLQISKKRSTAGSRG
jgi:hypothetical protein